MGSISTSGLERLNKTLRQQISDRDARISVTEKSLNKAKSELEDLTRIEKIERQRADDAEERAGRAEKSLHDAKNDLQRSQLDASNFEVQLRAEVAKSKQLGDEVKRLEYNLGFMSNSGSSQSQESKLAAKVKALEAELLQKDTELSRTKQDLRASTSSSSSNASRHRESSDNSTAQIQALSSDLEAVRESARDALAKEESLRSQLVDMGRERDKALNERMALEKRSQKEMEALNDRIEDLTYELQSHNGGAPLKSSKEAERLRAELRDVQSKLEAVELSFKTQSEELGQLRDRSASAAVDEGKIAQMSEKIADLESQLAAAQVQAGSSSPEDVWTHHLQRELKAALRRVDAKTREMEDLQMDLQDLREENEELRRTASADGVSPQDLAKIAELEGTIQTLEATLAEERASASQSVEEIERRLAADLEEASRTLEAERTVIAALRTDLESVTALKDGSTAELESVRQTLVSVEARVQELEADTQAAGARIEDAETALKASRQEIADAQTDRDTAKSALLSKEEALASVSGQLEAITLELQKHDANNQALEELRSSLADHEAEVANLRTKLQGSEEVVEALKTELMEMETSLSEEIERVQGELTVKETALSIATEDLERAKKDEAALHAHVKELELELGNRPVSEQGLGVDAAVNQTVQEAQADDTARFTQMSSTIQRLREERDELKGQLSFLQNERHFANREYKDERARLGTELQAAQNEVKQRVEQYGAVVREKEGLESRVVELELGAEADVARVAHMREIEAQLGRVTLERDAAVQRVLDIEAKLVESDARMSDSEAKLSDSEARLSESEAKLSESEAKLSHSETQLAASVKSLETKEAEFASALEAEQSSRRDAEIRAEQAILAQASHGNGEHEQLTTLHAQLERREQRIKSLNIDFHKLQMNHAVAQGNLKDLNEENEELKRVVEQRGEEIEQKSLEIEQKSQEIEQKSQEIEQKSQEIEQKSQEIEQKSQEIEQKSREIEQRSQEIHDVRAKLAESESLIARLQGSAADRQSTESELAALEDRLRTLQSEYEELRHDHGRLKGQHDELSAVHSHAKIEYDELTSEYGRVKGQFDELTDEHSRVKIEHSELRIQHDTLTSSYEARSSELDSLRSDFQLLENNHTSTVKERDILAAEGVEMVASLVDAREQLADATRAHAGESSQQVRDLVLAIAVQHQAVAEATARARESAAKLSQALSSISTLEQEHATLRDQMATEKQTAVEAFESEEKILTELQERVASMESELSEVRTKLAASEEQHESAVAELDTARTKLTASEQNHEAAISELKSQLEESRERSENEQAAAAGRVDAAQDEISSWSSKVDKLNVELDLIRKERDEASARVSNLEQSLTELDGLREDVAGLEAALAESTTSVGELTLRADKLHGEVSQLTTDKADLTAQVEAHVADIEKLQGCEDELRAELEAAQSKLAELEGLHAETQSAREAAEHEIKQLHSNITSMETRHEGMLMRMTALEEELTNARKEVTASHGNLAEADRLLKENADLKQTVNDLKDDLQRTVHSLTSKTNEVDEADDRAIDMNKDINKLRKRADRLDRLNKALNKEMDTLSQELGALKNAASNKSVPDAIPPPPSEQPQQARSPGPSKAAAPSLAAQSPARVAFTPTPTVRQFNVFEPVTVSVTPATRPPPDSPQQSSHKRSREDYDEYTTAEPRMQPAHEFGLPRKGTHAAHVRSPFAVRETVNGSHGRVVSGTPRGEKPPTKLSAQGMLAAKLAEQRASPYPPTAPKTGSAKKSAAFMMANAFNRGSENQSSQS